MQREALDINQCMRFRRECSNVRGHHDAPSKRTLISDRVQSGPW